MLNRRLWDRSSLRYPFKAVKQLKQHNYLIVQGALQGATNYLFNSTVELNKTYILSNSTVGFISFTIGMKNRLTNSTVGAIQNIAFNSTVESKDIF